MNIINNVSLSLIPQRKLNNIEIYSIYLDIKSIIKVHLYFRHLDAPKKFPTSVFEELRIWILRYCSFSWNFLQVSMLLNVNILTPVRTLLPLIRFTNITIIMYIQLAKNGIKTFKVLSNASKFVNKKIVQQ